MAMMTTREFIDLLRASDPDGTRLVMLRVWDEGDSKDIVAFGELDERAQFSLKNRRQMQGEDRDILRIDIPVSFV